MSSFVCPTRIETVNFRQKKDSIGILKIAMSDFNSYEMPHSRRNRGLARLLLVGSTIDTVDTVPVG